MPRYEYQCPKHGIMEITHSIHDPALTFCPKPVDGGFVRNTPAKIKITSPCGEPIKRLISGGIGIAMDTDKLWEPDPTSHKPRAERKSDLKKHEADLLGVPPEDRDRFRGYKRGQGDPVKM